MKKYNSIYEYLAEFFSLNPNPSEEQIQNARKEYWRMYFREYHRKRRKEKKEITLCFDKVTFKQLFNEKGSVRLSKYLYEIIKGHLHKKPYGLAGKETIFKLQRRLLKVVNAIDEINTSFEEVGENKFENVLIEIENIERELSLLL